MFFIHFIYLFLLFFSPKIGLIDLRLILLPVGLLFSKGSIRVPTALISFIKIIIFIILYSILISFLNNGDYQEIFRYFRILVSVFLTILFFSIPRITKSSINKVFITVLFMNVLVMFLNLLSPSFNSFIQLIYLDEGKELNKINRVIGLSSGYDTSGIIVLITGLYYFYMYKNNNNLILLFLLITTFVISFFISRGTILYVIMFSIIFGWKSLYNLSIKKVIYILSIVLLLSATIFPYVKNIFISSISSDMIDSDIDPNVIENQYAKTDPIEMVKSFYIIPKSTFGIFWGESNAVEVDSGYIKTLNQTGVFGIIITLISYCLLFSKVNVNKDEKFNFKIILFCILSLMIVANVKNQILFTRGIFEIYLFIIVYKLKYNA
jgi:hypothetical protein